MKRLFAGLALACTVGLGVACENAEPGAGSNTNWLRPCAEDAECGDGFSCVCGACTRACAGDCSGLPDAVCAEPGTASARAQCGAVAAQALCLPSCRTTADCARGQICVDGACVELAPPVTGSGDCGTGASLAPLHDAAPLLARHGTLFSESLYLPVEYAEPPADWTEPAPPTALTAQVTGTDGAPLEGCRVHFITREGSGLAFADAATTDAGGQVTAYWVAGAARSQRLSVALVRSDGSIVTRNVDGLAYANDEGAQSDAPERTVTAQPTTLRLYYDLPVATARLRVSVSPSTFPHHAFYAPIALPGFYTGLQNTSDLDPVDGDVPDAERALIASVWNLEEGDALQLFGASELVCSPHEEGRGGIRCMLPNAWSLGQELVFELERRRLAPGESVPEYAELGYVSEPCASIAGCTDYTVFFGAAASELTRVVAYRYASSDDARSFSSFLQAYSALPEQVSCLATPGYDVTFLPSLETDGVREPIESADFTADYASFHNQVCANYAASTDARGYRLVTGGPNAIDMPQLADAPPRHLALP